jgi:hypothetical protein
LTVLKISNSVPLSSFLQAERQTRSQRSFLIRTCIHGTMRRFADWFRFLGLWTLQLARHLAVERLVHNAIRELDQLDDRTLQTSVSHEVRSKPQCAMDCQYAGPTNCVNTMGPLLQRKNDCVGVKSRHE